MVPEELLYGHHASRGDRSESDVDRGYGWRCSTLKEHGVAQETGGMDLSCLVFLNGEIIPLEEARISPQDRGFNFADGLYEVIRVYNGQPFCMKEHMDRLKYGGEQLDIEIPYTMEEFAEIVERLLKANDLREASVYLQVTRGAVPRSHPFPEDYEPTVFMRVGEASAPSHEQLEQGMTAITHSDIRGGLCYIKSLALLANCLAQTRAKREGAYEAILVRNGFVTEATARSAFCVIDGTLYTHPLANILPSITRMNVLRLAAENDWPVVQQAIPVGDFMDADEVFLGGTIAEVVPIVEIDGKMIGDGRPGPVFWRVHKAFQDLIKKDSVPS